MVNYDDYHNAPSLREGIDNGLIKDVQYEHDTVKCDGETFHSGDWVIIQGWGGKGFMVTVSGRISEIVPHVYNGFVSWAIIVEGLGGGMHRYWSIERVCRLVHWKEKEKK